MNQSILALKEQLDAALQSVSSVAELESLKVEYLGKKGSITALLKNEDFKALFLSRLAMHLRTTYDTQRVLSQLNALAEQVGADIARNQARWGFSVGTWQQYVQHLRDFIDGATPRISEMMWDAQRFFSLTDAQMREIFGDLWAQ